MQRPKPAAESAGLTGLSSTFSFTPFVQSAPWLSNSLPLITVLLPKSDICALTKFREISKSWRDYIDRLPDVIYRDQILCQCVGRNSIAAMSTPPARLGTWRAMYEHVIGPTARLRTAIFPAADAPPPDPNGPRKTFYGQRPLVKDDVQALFDWLTALAETAACDYKRNFSLLFGNYARGMAHALFYLAYCSRSRILGPQADLLKWWQDIIVELRARIEARLDADSASAEDREVAVGSLGDFVRKMSTIPFHGMKHTDAALERGIATLKALATGGMLPSEALAAAAEASKAARIAARAAGWNHQAAEAAATAAAASATLGPAAAACDAASIARPEV